MRRNKLLVTVTSLALAAGCVPVTAGAAEQKGMQNYIVSTAEAKRQMNKEIAYAIGHVSELKNGSPGVRRAIIWGIYLHLSRM